MKTLFLPKSILLQLLLLASYFTSMATISYTENVTNITCFGADNGSITVTAKGGVRPYTYKWNNGATTATINNLAPNTYSFTVTDADNATASGSAAVSQPAVLVAPVTEGYNVTCNGSNNGGVTFEVLPSGGVAPYQYSLNGGAYQTGTQFTGLGPGTYFVTVEDSHACTITSNAVTITQPALLTLTDKIVKPCEGMANGSITISPAGGFAPYTYFWASGVGGNSGSGTVSNLAAGTYGVTVDDANKCSATKSVILNSDAAVTPTISITSSTAGPVCQGTVITFKASITNGGSNPDYEWTLNGATATDSGKATFLTTTNAGEAFNSGLTVSCTLISNGACVSNPSALSNQIDIKVNPNPVANAGAGGTNCTGGVEGFELGNYPTASGGKIPYTYKWSPAKTLVGDTDANPIAYPTVTTAYTVKVTDAYGCSASSSATVSVGIPVTPQVSITDNAADTICSGTAVTFTARSINSGPDPVYDWYVNGALASGDTGSGINGNTFITSSLSGTAKVYCKLISDDICVTSNAISDTLSTVVKITPSAAVTANGPTTTCATSVKLTAATGAATYKWSNGQTTKIITVKKDGTYTVTATGSDGCAAVSSPETVELKTLSIPPITYVNSDSTAPCDSTATFELTVNDGSTVSYLWSTGATTTPITVRAGTYSVTITNGSGCSAEDSINATCGNNDVAGKTGDNADDVYASSGSNAGGMNIIVFPNPYSTEFRLIMQSSSDSNFNIAVYDVTGRLLEERNDIVYGSVPALGHGYAAGVYVVRLTQGTLRRSVKVVKAE